MSYSFLSTALLVSALGCSAAVSPDGNPALKANTSLEVTRAPVAATALGRVKRIGDALGQVSLRPDQRATLEAMAVEANARDAATLAAKQDFAAVLASQIETGTLDRAALAPKMGALVDAETAAQPKDRAAFEALHDLLDPAQRAEFADAMMEHGHGHGHGWDTMKGHGHGQRWADDLQLTDDQRAQFEQIVRDSFAAHREEMATEHGEHGGFHGGHHGALLDAFRGDTFSFDAVAPREDVGAKTVTRVNHLLGLAEKVLPILTPQQRSLAAQKIREHVDQLPMMP